MSGITEVLDMENNNALKWEECNIFYLIFLKNVYIQLKLLN